MLTAELAERGIGTRHFAGSKEFLLTLDRTIDAHVIVLDWHMPKMSGIDLLAAIRRRGVKLPVVFLTGQNLIQHEKEAFERGAMDFIEKSRGVETLVGWFTGVGRFVVPIAVGCFGSGGCARPRGRCRCTCARAQ